MKEIHGYKLSDFSELKKAVEIEGTHLVIDNNRDGVQRFASYNKSFLSRKLNAAGHAVVFLLSDEFLPLSKKILSEYHFEE